MILYVSFSFVEVEGGSSNLPQNGEIIDRGKKEDTMNLHLGDCPPQISSESDLKKDQNTTATK